MPARRISRPSSRMKLRPSLIARTLAEPAGSKRQAVDAPLSVRAPAAGNMMAMHDTQQNRASATSRRPPMRATKPFEWGGTTAVLVNLPGFHLRTARPVVLPGANVVYFVLQQDEAGGNA